MGLLSGALFDCGRHGWLDSSWRRRAAVNINAALAHRAAEVWRDALSDGWQWLLEHPPPVGRRLSPQEQLQLCRTQPGCLRAAYARALGLAEGQPQQLQVQLSSVAAGERGREAVRMSLPPLRLRPCPDVAAALAAGYLPVLGRLLRKSAVLDSICLMEPHTHSSQVETAAATAAAWSQLLVFGPPEEARAFVAEAAGVIGVREDILREAVAEEMQAAARQRRQAEQEQKTEQQQGRQTAGRRGAGSGAVVAAGASAGAAALGNEAAVAARVAAVARVVATQLLPAASEAVATLAAFLEMSHMFGLEVVLSTASSGMAGAMTPLASLLGRVRNNSHDTAAATGDTGAAAGGLSKRAIEERSYWRRARDQLTERLLPTQTSREAVIDVGCICELLRAWGGDGDGPAMSTHLAGVLESAAAGDWAACCYACFVVTLW
eukprot:XP_001699604.1 predicted protein [Chlamydomonas reinhardtii]